jgi:flagellar biosynthesis/type III secretory pathway protein FliH
MSEESKKTVIENNNVSSENLDNTSIQASKSNTEVVQEQEKVPTKARKPLTEAQKLALAEGRKKGREKINERNALINKEKEEMKTKLEMLEKELHERKTKEFEDKLVKKAVSIKKKQIKKELVLDEISDDDTNLEEIKELKKRAKKATPTPAPTPAPTPQPKGPKYVFV